MMPQQDLFAIPPAIRRIFDSFPLIEYPPNNLPASCAKPAAIPTLYVFNTPEDAACGRPSFNPGCLKWQTYFNLCGIAYKTVSSNNHASPSGALPFLIPASNSTNIIPEPIPTNKLVQWAEDSGWAPRGSESNDPDVQAFLALVNTRVRDAWLYALYIEPHNFKALARIQYRSTAVSLVNHILSNEYQTAAMNELYKFSSGVINAADIYADAESAFTALATVLGDSRWMFGAKAPGLFDATVFGYTHLILNLSWNKQEEHLLRMVRKHQNLVDHERRIWKLCFSKSQV
ncbi:hypothetical protein EDC01DRAFT_83208 [Geopyxis carbonaria]|nr:hypothetical protein EDC01DRAFT_83208 [Geopyxis carbonaria]